jgi:hypothetical protein|tara:strand:+ start:900 stop:1289 length:390 start_codon:yes stop_codon:yes gene_type:complete
MEFFIRKDATEPILKMQLIQDGRNDYMSFHDKLANSSIGFSMRREDTGEFVILNKSAGIVSKTSIEPNAPVEYYIYYRWQSSDTSEVGRYQAQFDITFIDDGSELIVPVRDDLFININDSFVRSQCKSF